MVVKNQTYKGSVKLYMKYYTYATHNIYIKRNNMSKYVQKIKLHLKHKMADLLDLVQLRESTTEILIFHLDFFGLMSEN